MKNSYSKSTAVITVASWGIGAISADRLAKRGYNLDNGDEWAGSEAAHRTMSQHLDNSGLAPRYQTF